MKFVIIALLMHSGTCSFHEKWPLIDHDNTLDLRNLQKIPNVPSNSNGNSSFEETEKKKKTKKKGKTLRQRQIEEYEALQAEKLYLNYD